MRKTIAITGAAIALGAFVANANANVSAKCIMPGTIEADVTGYNPSVDHQVNIWTSVDATRIPLTAHNGGVVKQFSSPFGDNLVVYLQRQDGGNVYQSAPFNCNVPPTTPEKPPVVPPVTPKPPVTPMPPKKPTPPIRTSRKVFTIKAVGCVIGKSRSYTIQRTRVTITQGGKIIRVVWSKPVKKLGKFCPLPPVTG